MSQTRTLMAFKTILLIGILPRHIHIKASHYFLFSSNSRCFSLQLICVHLFNLSHDLFVFLVPFDIYCFSTSLTHHVNYPSVMCVPVILSSWFSTSWGVNQCVTMLCIDFWFVLIFHISFPLPPVSYSFQIWPPRLRKHKWQGSFSFPAVRHCSHQTFLTCFLSVFFCCSLPNLSSHQFGAPCVLDFCLFHHCTFPFSPCIFDELTDRNQQKTTCSGEEPTTGPQARNGRRRPGSVAVDTGASCEFVLFPFYFGRGFIFHLLPVLA